MKTIDPIKEEEDDEDELQGLTIEEKQPRKVGQFIKHEDFNDDLKPEDGQDDPYKDLTELEKVFEMDHDFRCIQRQRNEEFEQRFSGALERYINGEWQMAEMDFKGAQDIAKNEPTLDYFINFMEKQKSTVPEDWKQGWDHDKLLEPPEIEWGEEEFSESNNQE